MARKKRTVLSKQQTKAIELYAYKDVNGLSNKDIAKEIGVTERTLYNWKNDPLFTQALSELSIRIMRGFLTETYQELSKIINSPESRDSDRLKAIKLVLQRNGKLEDRAEYISKGKQPDLLEILEELRTIE